jgi:HD superfamily phosphohydrolase
MKLQSHSNQVAKSRFAIELEALELMDCDGIPKVLDSGNDGDLSFIVMTIAPGQTILSQQNKWRKKGRVHGALEVAAITLNILSTVKYIHDRGRVHRDINDSNVLIDGEAASVVDFAFCKAIGQSQARDRASSWGEGDPRFSPKTKLETPSLALPTHDIYAVGVLAYNLLTGVFPWASEEVGDGGALRHRMATSALVQPHEINSMVPLVMSRFVAGLLTQEDLKRPTAHDAMNELSIVLEILSNKSAEPPWRAALVSRPHVLRDQVHGDVRLTDFEYRVLNTREMQRLRWIKQLGLTNLVYTGAEHSRLAHSIGAVESVERILTTIEQESGVRIESDTRNTARLFALTHDVSHIASGHTIEDELGFFPRHDKNQARFDRLVGDANSQIGKLLRSNDAGRAVIELLDPSAVTSSLSLVEEMVSGVMGADVLDYVDRDAINCGLDHRVDSAIYRQIKFHARERPDSKIYSYEGSKYGIRIDRHYAVENLLAERYALFLKVYTHRAKIAADAVLSKALTLRRKAIKEAEFEWFGDDALLGWLESQNRQLVAQRLGQRLRNRQLPRGVYRAQVIDSSVDSSLLGHSGYLDEQSRLQQAGRLTPQGRASFEAEVSRKTGISTDRLFFYLPATAPGYKLTELWASSIAGSNPKLDARQEGTELGRKHLALWQAWLFVADATDDERLRAAQEAETIFRRPNLIDQLRQSLFTDFEH